MDSYTQNVTNRPVNPSAKVAMKINQVISLFFHSLGVVNHNAYCTGVTSFYPFVIVVTFNKLKSMLNNHL